MRQAASGGGACNGGLGKVDADADGFTTVQRKLQQKSGGGNEDQAMATAATSSEQQAAAEDDSHGGAADDTVSGEQQRRQDTDADAGQGQDLEEGAEPTADELYAKWQRELRLVAWMAEQGYAEDDPARLDAAHRAAQAEAAWKGTKPGVRTSQRLIWAEQALTRARKAQAKQEQAIDELDAWYEAERLSQTQWLAELRARSRRYEQNLEDISRQAAAEFSSSGGGR